MVLLILAAVSGTGKSTIARELLRRQNQLKLSVSHTTRQMRAGESDGVHYHFVNRTDFDSMVIENGFAEWAEYVGNAYGTAKTTIEMAKANSTDLVFDIEIQGARQIKAQYPDALMVFLLPPDWSEVRRRLESRGTDDPATVEARLKRGQIEMASASEFDYLVVNKELDQAVSDVEAIYRAAKLRTHQQSSRLDSLL